MPYYEIHPTRQAAMDCERRFKQKKSAQSLWRIIHKNFPDLEMLSQSASRSRRLTAGLGKVPGSNPGSRPIFVSQFLKIFKGRTTS